VVKLDAEHGKVIFRATNGTTHEFQATKEVLQTYKWVIVSRRRFGRYRAASETIRAPRAGGGTDPLIRHTCS